ncbi:MAG: hypothetical protein IJR33_08595 [Clostridia bacterium]|nr:hypothetical protein [Clostridia bacterium]
MPRGDNPNSRANLIKSADLPPKERRERAKKASAKSAEVRAGWKSFPEIIKENTSEEEQLQIYKAVKQRAKQGNLKAFEIIRDTVGEKPVDKIMVAEVDSDIINEVEAIFDDGPADSD